MSEKEEWCWHRALSSLVSEHQMTSRCEWTISKSQFVNKQPFRCSSCLITPRSLLFILYLNENMSRIIDEIYQYHKTRPSAREIFYFQHLNVTFHVISTYITSLNDDKSLYRNEKLNATSEWGAKLLSTIMMIFFIHVIIWEARREGGERERGKIEFK